MAATLREYTAKRAFHARPPHAARLDKLPSEGHMEARFSRLESGVEHIRRDMAETRADVRQINVRLSALECISARTEARLDATDAKIDTVERTLTEKIDTVQRTLSDKIDGLADRYMTKHQFALWALAGAVAVLGSAAALIGVLLRAMGHPLVADVFEAISHE